MEAMSIETTTAKTKLTKRHKLKRATQKPAGGKAKSKVSLVLNKPSLLLVAVALFFNLLLLVCAIAGCSAAATAAAQAPEAVKSLAAQTSGSGVGSDELAQETSGAEENERALLEAELESIVRQHEAKEASNKQLSEAIISMLMLGNLSEPTKETSIADSLAAAAELERAAAEQSDGANAESAANYISAPDSIRLRKLISYLQNYEPAQFGGEQFPILPASPAATIKRASAKMSGYLRQQQSQRQLNNFGRNQFDFGLGKRPDYSVMGNVLRLGDSSIGSGQAVSGGGQLGKRPSHRYDFGLGKRLASPTYPRYDFGLGKRAPSRVRYDFGLGK